MLFWVKRTSLLRLGDSLKNWQTQWPALETNLRQLIALVRIMEGSCSFPEWKGCDKNIIFESQPRLRLCGYFLFWCCSCKHDSLLLASLENLACFKADYSDRQYLLYWTNKFDTVEHASLVMTISTFWQQKKFYRACPRRWARAWTNIIRYFIGVPSSIA